MKSNCILSVISVMILSIGNLFAYDNTYAVIVAINDYQNFGRYSGDLEYTISDARSFNSFLQSSKGGSVPATNIYYLTDSKATKSNIIYYAKKLFARAKTNDRVIFYFSGHGSSGCFVPYDATINGGNLLYFSEVKEVFRAAKCNTKLLFADACYSGSMKKNASKQLQEKMNAASNKDSNMNIAVMMSCANNETSLESGELNHGLFTYYLIQGLGGSANSDGNKYVTIQELYYYVNQKVRAKANSMGHTQTPVLFGNFDLRLIVAKV